MQYKESLLQEHFAHWLDGKGILFNASMAGVYLGIPAAIRRKKMGAKKGFPDLFIYQTTDKYCGLAIELKVEKSITPEQKQWQEALQQRGYYAVIMPHGLEFQEGLNWLKKTVEDYLNSK